MPKSRRHARTTPGPVITDKFSVIPIQPEQVECKRDSRGMLHLRLNAPPKKLSQKIAGLLGYDYTSKLELDEYGTFYYEQVDGETPLDEIVTRMTEKLGVDRETTAEKVVLFTKKLMVMNMLALKIPQGAEGEETR